MVNKIKHVDRFTHSITNRKDLEDVYLNRGIINLAHRYQQTIVLEFFL